jgi:hypothetical protein
MTPLLATLTRGAPFNPHMVNGGKDLADASEISVAPRPLMATAIVREVANVADTPRTLESSGTLFFP